MSTSAQVGLQSNSAQRCWSRRESSRPPGQTTATSGNTQTHQPPMSPVRIQTFCRSLATHSRSWVFYCRITLWRGDGVVGELQLKLAYRPLQADGNQALPSA